MRLRNPVDSKSKEEPDSTQNKNNKASNNYHKTRMKRAPLEGAVLNRNQLKTTKDEEKR